MCRNACARRCDNTNFLQALMQKIPGAQCQVSALEASPIFRFDMR